MSLLEIISVTVAVVVLSIGVVGVLDYFFGEKIEELSASFGRFWDHRK